ncbi:hypothetical protein F2P81_019654 [Scophthalmus maximus]|uniref:HotDog ACOT-type domain-containing protein n=1 Tax=Scophthalmus maximus TaxID=52904 RepID=A0A6A4S674_SCOMX|nr:hypothetical protein F2P81_019654 [Scophthalmus maximus]
MFSPRFQLLRSAASLTTRSLCSGGVSKHGRAPDMVEVRNRLREIVGASTNWRFGRILEDLDSLAVLISYSHTYNPALKKSPLSIVTALVDKIVLDATFVMVARDPENKRAAFVNPLKPDGPEEENIFQQGEDNKFRRVELSTASLLKVAPTDEERKIVHGLFLNTLDTQTVSFSSRVLPPNSVWMENAKLKGLEICHPQERNIFNRIFGGFLMRKAYELGWANACSFG